MLTRSMSVPIFYFFTHPSGHLHNDLVSARKLRVSQSISRSTHLPVCSEGDGDDQDEEDAVPQALGRLEERRTRRRFPFKRMLPCASFCVPLRG
jgi:hypothetical protein